jgi:LysR family transcriptional regulator, low CO2-responsive transcriptional regulator
LGEKLILKKATLHQLKVFEICAKQGSFTKAAEELMITQPTVSTQIKQLTQAIGLPLFEQIGKRLYLTNAGKALLETCQEIFTSLDNFDMKVAALQGMKKGKLSLSVITTAKYFIPRLLGSFCQKYPDIDISLQFLNHENLQKRMLKNKDDLYILSNLPQEIDLCSEVFLDNPLVVVTRKDHPLVNKNNIPITTLNNESFIMREAGSGTRKAIQNLFNQHNINVKVRLELGSNEAIKQAIVGGLGISVLSRHTLIGESNGELTVIDVQNFPIKKHWYATYLNGKQLSIVAQTFLEFLLVESKHIPVYDSKNNKH